MTTKEHNYLRVLIVEDDKTTAQLVNQEVTALGWRAMVVQSVQAARAEFTKVAYDIVVLDRMLDGQDDGLTLLTWFRELESALPGVLVASQLGGVQDHIRALDLGADDYINKPYDLEELSARLKAIARRLKGKREPESVDFWEDLEIRNMNRSARWQGKLLPLRPQSFQVLRVLVASKGEYVSRATLWHSVWASYKNLPPQDTVINTAISRLRGELGAISGAPIIHSDHLGYRLELAPGQ